MENTKHSQNGIANFGCYDNDVKQISSAVRIFGTQKQIDKAFEDICTLTGLNLDECYTYEIEKKGSFHSIIKKIIR